MTKTKSPTLRIAKKKKNDLFGKVFAGVVIGTGIVGTTAILMSAPFKNEYPAQPLPQARVEAPIRQATEMEPVVVETPEAKPAPVEKQKPVVALPHDQTDTDFVAQSSQELADGDVAAAFVSLRKSLFGVEPSVDTLLRIGRLGREIGELEIAEQALLDAQKLDARDAVVKVELARVYMKQGETRKAHDVATDAINIDKDDGAAWNLVGRSAMGLSEWERAEAAFSQAVEIDPLNAMYRNNLGLLFIHMKRADEAVDELETAVELFEDQAPHFVFNNLGLAHELAQNYEEAREAFEEALVISPFYARAKVNLRRVETTIATLEEKRAFETAKSIEPEIEIDDLDEMTEDI